MKPTTPSNGGNGACHGTRPFLTALLLLFTLSAADAKVLYVKPTGLDTNTGLSWDLAMATVTAAMTAARSGDEVWVAAGTYGERVTVRPGAGLYGGFAGTETARTQRNSNTNVTILDGAAGGRVVTLANSPSTSVVDGFTIRNGAAATGAGVYLSSSSAVVTHNIIASNQGQGVYVTGASSPLIASNIIQYNTGGGIQSVNATPTITGNYIRWNQTTANGAGINLVGAAATISNNVILGNVALGGISIGNGGGIKIYNASPVIRNNLIAWNTAISGGGLQIEYRSSPIVANNTIVFNGSEHRYNAGGIGMSTDTAGSSSPVIVNNIIAYNSSGIRQADVLTTPTLSHNDLFDNYAFAYNGLAAGPSDLSVDPGLLSVRLGDYHLAVGSPLVDAGDDTFVPAGSTDIDGSPRIGGAHVDIGADEFTTARIPIPSRRVLFVKPAGADTNAGTSWATAKATIQAALDAALPGDDVWVAAGTYSEHLTLKAGVMLLAGFSGVEASDVQRNPVTNPVIVDGGNSGRLVYAPNVGTTSGMDGFTLRNGSADTGAGIEAYFASPILSNLDIGPNQGVGLYAYYATPYLVNSTIHDGSDTGLYADNSTPIITNCTITHNSSIGHGGGVYCHFSSPIITNSRITGNSAQFLGGGVYCYKSSPSLIANTVADNAAATNGGAMYLNFSSPVIASNVFVGNTSSATGGLKLYNGSSPAIYNNTIVANVSTTTNQAGGVSMQSNCSPTIANNIITLNTGYGVRRDDTTCSPVVSHNDLWSNTQTDYFNITAGPGDIFVDPRFVDAAGRNFHLRGDSPDVNTGDDQYIKAGETDIDRQPRIYGTSIDIGADERMPFGAVDFNGDNKPDIVAANYGAGRLAILTMNGNAILASIPVSPGLPAGVTVAGIGDLNGDGQPDVVVENPNTGTLSVLVVQGFRVTGSYSLTPNLPSGWHLMALGDFNGDNQAALVVQNPSTSQISILTVNGTQITGSTPITPTLPANWQVVGTGDFDGNGTSDIVVQNTLTREISILFLTGSKVTSSVPILPTLPVGWVVVGVGDYDGNTWPDILVQNTGTRQLSILRMNGTTIVQSAPVSPTLPAGWQVVGPK